MKKLFSIVLGLLLVLGFAGKVSANKPNGNFPGAQKVDWNLSGAVMPAPYGSMDIPGSDIKSRLIVNQPRCDTKALINGEMKGLNPNTLYTVYLSNGYTAYKDTGWNISGSYIFDYEWNGGHYPNDVIITQTGSSVTGTINWPSGSPYLVSGTVAGTVTGNTVILTVAYNDRPYLRTMTGTIAADGSISGNWNDANPPANDNGSWSTPSGVALKTHTGDVGWPGLFTNTVQPFTFTTNRMGMGEWHLNLGKSDFPAAGTYTLSVWVNGGGATILISDDFKLTLSSSDRKCWKDKDGDHDSRDFRDFHWRMPFGPFR